MWVVVAREVWDGEPTGQTSELPERFATLGEALCVANALSRTGVTWGYVKKPGHRLSFEV